MKKKFVIIMFAICCFFMAVTCTKYATNNNLERVDVRYLKTSDGDTARFEIDGENTRVRFLGINTPEVSGENKVEEPYGNEALAYTRNKLENAKKIEIEYDDVADKEDRFGRKLAWLWVDDELYEVELLEQGLAKTYMLQDDYKYAAELKNAESKAKRSKVGVWADGNLNINDIGKSTSDVSENEVQEDFAEYDEIKNDNSIIYIIIVLIISILSAVFKGKVKK